MSSLFLLVCCTLSIYFSYGVGSSFQSCRSMVPRVLKEVSAGRTAPPLPIAKSITPQFLRPVGYNLVDIRPGVFAIDFGGYYAMVIYKNEHLVLIDSPLPVGGSSASVRLMGLAAMEVLNGSKPYKIDMIYSHSHFDHIGSATTTLESLKAKFPMLNAKIWASKDAAKFIRKSGSKKAPFPTNTFRRKKYLRVGGYRSSLRIVLKVVGGHTEDDILVHILPDRKNQGVAYLVDMIFPGWTPTYEFALTQNLREYIAVHDEVLKLNFGTFIGGHLTRFGTREDVAISKQYTLFILESARKAIKTAPSYIEIAAGEGVFNSSGPAAGNVLFAFNKYQRTIDRICARAVIDEWACRLGGVEVFAETLCFAARFYLQLDV